MRAPPAKADNKIMAAWISRLRWALRAEDGLALTMTMGLLVLFSVGVVAATTMTTVTQSTATMSSAAQNGFAVAEAGVNDAEAILNYQNSNGGNPTAANLLGCAGLNGATDTTAPSNCSSPTPIVFCITAAAGCSAGQSGTASVFGYFSGTNPGSYGGYSVAASSWLIVSTATVAGPSGQLVERILRATIKVSPLGQGGVGAVWNHIFITAPRVANTCQLDFSGANNVNINVPIYTVGNVCLGSNTVQESTQPIDLMVGGSLYIGSGSVGVSSSVPITAGVIVGGCSTVSISASMSPCDNGTFHYWTKTKDTFVPQDAPSLTSAQMASDYTTFDPSPNHPCLAGTTPAPLASSVFDSSTGGASEPDDSGSTTAGSAFQLVPNSSYACISQNGTSTGYLIWNNSSNSSLTVNGITVPAKTLAVNGSIFFDSDVTIGQSFTYSGVGIVEAAGTISFDSNSHVYVCAVSGCTTGGCPSNWEGSSGNTSMLTLAALAPNTTSIKFGVSNGSNNIAFEGSLWAQPSSTVDFKKNGDLVAGPISIGSFDSTFNNATLCPLPVIKNMPTGAPLPPNVGISIAPPFYLT